MRVRLLPLLLLSPLACSVLRDVDDISQPGQGQAGTTASGGAGQGGQGGQATCQPASAADYLIAEVSETPITLNGQCDEPSWKLATKFQFRGAKSGQWPTPPDCRWLWESAGQRLYGCCEVEDEELFAVVEQSDKPINAPPHVWHDDSVEYFIKGNQNLLLDAATQKAAINLRGVYTDTAFPNQEHDTSQNFDVQAKVALDGDLTTGNVDRGYTIEWSMALGFGPKRGDLGACVLRVNDADSANSAEINAIMSSGSALMINEPDTWGICQFGCPAATGG